MGLDGFGHTLKMEIELDEDAVQTEAFSTPSTNFNTIIGYIEDIVISANFQVRNKPFDLQHIVNWIFFLHRNFKKTFSTNIACCLQMKRKIKSASLKFLTTIQN